MPRPAVMSKLAEIVTGGSPVEKARSRVESAEGELSKLAAEIDATRARIRDGALAERSTLDDERRLGELEARRPGLTLRLEALRPSLAEAERKAAEEVAAKRRVEDEEKLAKIADEARLVRLGAVGGGKDFLAGLARLDLLARNHETIAGRLSAPALRVERTPASVLADSSALVLDELDPNADPPMRVAAIEVAFPVIPGSERLS